MGTRGGRSQVRAGSLAAETVALGFAYGFPLIAATAIVLVAASAWMHTAAALPM